MTVPALYSARVDGDALSDLLYAAYPRCELCGRQLDDVGTEEHPYFRCSDCDVAVVPRL